jgi:hypothetical protein
MAASGCAMTADLRYFAAALPPSLSRRGACKARQSGRFAFTHRLPTLQHIDPEGEAGRGLMLFNALVDQ